MHGELSRQLETLAAKFATTVPHLWEVIQHGLLADSAYTLVISSALGAFFSTLAWRTWKILRRARSNIDLLPILIGLGFCASVCFVYLLEALRLLALLVLSPEYATLDYVLRALHE